MSELTKIYVTKYALTSGPFCVMAEISNGGNMASYRLPGCYVNHVHGKDFWLEEDDALDDCERRRKAKIKTINKQKNKLEGIDFTFKGISA